MKCFVDMKFPPPMNDVLKSKNMKRPTPIQMQGLTVALASRDMIGIEFRMPLVLGEGPIGIILAPSRELAWQTYTVADNFCQQVSKTTGYPELGTQLLIGGESVRDQLSLLLSSGVHCIVATPGRLRDVLK
jgi:ATP-dependent RNA helicase DDX41